MENINPEKTGRFRNERPGDSTFAGEVNEAWGPRKNKIDQGSTPSSDVEARRSLKDGAFAEWLHNWLTSMDAKEIAAEVRKAGHSSKEELTYAFGQGLAEGETGGYDDGTYVYTSGLPEDQKRAYVGGYTIGKRLGQTASEGNINPRLIELFRESLR